VVPVYQPGEGGPRIDPQKRALTLLRELTAADFPERPLTITQEGDILR
jgi:hypothetical protein